MTTVAECLALIEECGREMRKVAGCDSLADRIAFFLDWYYPACESVEHGAKELAAFIERGEQIPQSYKDTGRVISDYAQS